MKVRELINLLQLADPEAYVVNGQLSASLLPEITKAREARALCKAKKLNDVVVRRFIEADKSADCKMVILK